MGLSHRRDDNGLLWVEFTAEGHRPPLLTAAVFDALREVIGSAESDPPPGLIFCGEPGGDFQAGVDLDDMARVASQQAAFRRAREGQLLFQRIARLPFPTVAAIEGRCIGGGTELALACASRIAADHPDTAIALPEVQLGILPGFGGTQRLPRLIGQYRALDMILTGRAVGASRALAWGLVDRLAPPGELRDAAVALVADLNRKRFRPAGPRLWRRPRELILEGLGAGRRAVRKRYMKAVRARTRGHFPAPERAIEAVGLAADRLPLNEGLEREAEMLAELLSGPVHRHMLRLLRARQALRRPRGGSPERAEGPPIDLAEGFEPPKPLVETLAALASHPPDPGGAAAEPGDVPPIDTAEGIGLLRRLPSARRPHVVEVTWYPAAGGPAGFQDVARRLVTAAGAVPVYCRSAEPSPGLNLLAAYLREGDRLSEEGWNREEIDDVLEEWGMASGPFALAERMGPDWERRMRTIGTRQPPGPPLLETPAALDPEDTGAGERLVEEVVAALVLEISRMWDLVDAPAEAGWSVLEAFVLGAPVFRGGMLGAARRMGDDRILKRLRGLARRRGPRYAPDALIERGLLKEEGRAP